MKARPLRKAIELKQFSKPISDLFASHAERIDLGFTLDHLELAHGEPGSLPADDRIEMLTQTTPEGRPAIDYADPTGEAAVRRQHLDRRHTRMQDAMQDIARGLNVLIAESQKAIGSPPTADVMCDVCGGAGEATTAQRTKFVGVRTIAGYHTRKHGTTVRCRTCRKVDAA